LEEDFAKFIDLSEKVVWWYKNGDNYGKYLGILYTSEEKERTFYPDFIIKTVKKVWIIDTKSGLITQDAFRSGKVKALTNWLESNPGCDGGIVVRDGDIWKIHHRITQKEEIIDELVVESNINYYPKKKI